MDNGFLNIKSLREGQVAGPDTMNPIIRLLKGLASRSEWVGLAKDGQGSAYVDFDAGGYARWVLNMVPKLAFGFRASIPDVSPHRLYIEEGRVWFPDRVITVPAATVSGLHDGYMAYVRITQAGYNGDPAGVEIRYSEGITHTLQTDDDDYRLTVPLCRTENSGGWGITYLNLGDVVLAETPYFWVDNYDRQADQSLDHRAGEHGLRWRTYRRCE